MDVRAANRNSDKCRRAYSVITQAGRSIDFSLKDKRMFWRGVLHVPFGQDMPHRVGLVKTTAEHPDIADIKVIEWGDGNNPTHFVGPNEMCAWKYIIYTEGCFLFKCVLKVIRCHI